MPSLSPTMESGDLSRWLVKEGDQVKVGSIIAEVETDKAMMELESVDNGIVGKILIKAGTKGVKVGAVIAVLLKSGESSTMLDNYKVTEESKVQITATIAPSSSTKQEAQAKPIEIAIGQQVEAINTKVNAPIGSDKKISFNSSHTLELDGIKSAGKGSEDLETIASPLARRLAQLRGVDISKVFGSGPRGMIIKRDVELFTSKDGSCETLTYTPGRITSGQSETIVPLTSMRKTIARRLMESKLTIPHFYLSIEADMTKAMEMRADINAHLAEKYCDFSKITVNDIIVKAIGLALEGNPEINRRFEESGIIQYSSVDVSVAISVDAGLIVPTLCDVNIKPITHIAREMKDFVQRARTGKITAHEMSGGALTISNLGSFGIRQFYGIINPPQASILCFGSVYNASTFSENGEIKQSQLMNVSMSADHRVLDGVDAALFLESLKSILASPVCLFL